MKVASNFDLIVEFCQAVERVRDKLQQAVSAINDADENPYAYQQVSETLFSPVEVVNDFESAVRDYLDKVDFDAIPPSCRVEWGSVAWAVEEAIPVLQDMKNRWSALFPKGQGYMVAMNMMGKVAEATEVFLNINRAVDSIAEAAEIARVNQPVIVGELKHG